MTESQVAQEIRQIETRRFEAVVRGDLVTLDQTLSEDLTYTHASAVFETKAEFLGKMRSGQLKYEIFEPHDLRVRVYGTAAVITGIARVKVQVGGNPQSFRLRFTDVYAHQNGRWQMVAWQATRLPEA